jgi:hypothetical protein
MICREVLVGFLFTARHEYLRATPNIDVGDPVVDRAGA